MFAQLVVGTRCKISELGTLRCPDLADKTGTVVEVSLRSTASQCCLMAAQDRPACTRIICPVYQGNRSYVAFEWNMRVAILSGSKPRALGDFEFSDTSIFTTSVIRRAEPRGTESLRGGGAAAWVAAGQTYPPTKQPAIRCANDDHTERDARGLRQCTHCWPPRRPARADRWVETTRALCSAPITKRKSGPKLIADAGPTK